MASGARTLPVALLLFFSSGFAALLYQVVWQRLLALFSGADVFSVTLIVSAFMGGLGVGNLAGGHLADRSSRSACLLWFGLAELAIGAFALASRRLYYDVLYAGLGVHDFTSPVLGAILFASLLGPTFLMGLSLPLLARGLTDTLERAAPTVGALYGWNTFGAAAGAAIGTWVLLRRFDVEACLRVGAAANVLCAGVSLVLRARVEPGSPRQPGSEPAPPRAGSGLPFWAWMVVYGLAGAIALSLEIVWFRVLGVVQKSTSFTFGTLLAFYLLGTAGGTLVGTRLVQGYRGDPAARFLRLQTAAVAWALAAVSAVHLVSGPDGWGRLVAHLGSTDHGFFLAGLDAFAEHGLSALLADGDAGGAARLFALVFAGLPALLIVPATALMGASFPFLQRAIQNEPATIGRRVGWLQTANIAGCLAGSLLTGFVLLPRVGTSGVFRALAGAALCFPVLALFAGGRSGPPRRLAPLAGLAALAGAIALFPGSRPLWANLHGIGLVDFVVREDADGVSALAAQSDAPGVMVMAGGVEVSSIPFGGYGGIHTLLGALPVLIHPRPSRVLVIGIGSGDTAYAAAARPETSEVVAVEIMGSQVALLASFARRWPDPGLRAFVRDRRIRKVVGDGRIFLRRSRTRWDVVEADALRVTSAYSGNVYSAEYFASVREALAPGGLAVTWLPTARVKDTLLRAFPYVTLVGHVGIGSDAPIPFDRERIRERLRDPRPAAHFERAGVAIEPLVESFLDRADVAAYGPEFDRAALHDVNSDLFAKDEFLYVDGRRPR